MSNKKNMMKIVFVFIFIFMLVPLMHVQDRDQEKIKYDLNNKIITANGAPPPEIIGWANTTQINLNFTEFLVNFSVNYVDIKISNQTELRCIDGFKPFNQSSGDFISAWDWLNGTLVIPMADKNNVSTEIDLSINNGSENFYYENVTRPQGEVLSIDGDTVWANNMIIGSNGTTVNFTSNHREFRYYEERNGTLTLFGVWSNISVAMNIDYTPPPEDPEPPSDPEDPPNSTTVIFVVEDGNGTLVIDEENHSIKLLYKDWAIVSVNAEVNASGWDKESNRSSIKVKSEFSQKIHVNGENWEFRTIEVEKEVINEISILLIAVILGITVLALAGVGYLGRKIKNLSIGQNDLSPPSAPPQPP